MSRAKITEEKNIQITMENVRSFYNRNLEVTTAPMREDFMWIGSNDFQWREKRYMDLKRYLQKGYEQEK